MFVWKCQVTRLLGEGVTEKIILKRVISNFRHEEDEISALLGCYAECSGNSLPNFPVNISSFEIPMQAEAVPQPASGYHTTPADNNK